MVHSRLGGALRIRSYVPLKGNGLQVATGSCPNSFWYLPILQKPLISKEITPQQPVLYRTYEYDLMTEDGKDYELKCAAQ